MAGAGLVLAALTCVPGAPPARAAEPVRILVVGDSISQGSSGDWTWRYRLWEHLTGHGVAVDLVGPRTDLYDNVGGAFGSQAYLDPAFDRDHAARWGMKLGAPDVPIANLVSTYTPDIVVVMLGDNDLSAGQTPEQVRDLLRGFVTSARSVDPGLEVVLGRDPRPLIQPKVPAYNALVTDLADELDSPASHVVVANTDVGYDDYNDTWDGAHPNARGELKIAAAFADALHALDGALPAADPIPTVPLGPRLPPQLSATGGVGSVALTWVRSPGSQESEVWARDATVGEAWHRVAEHVTGLGYTMTGLTASHRVQARTEPLKGFWVAQPDAWSNVVEVVVPGTSVPSTGPGAVPVTLPALAPVLGVRARRTRHGVRTTAEGVPGATSYTLRVARTARCGQVPSDGRFSVAASGLTRLTKQLRLHSGAVWVRWVALRDGVEGDLAPASTACAKPPP
jgi:lysophospholipase L1-like esterase